MYPENFVCMLPLNYRTNGKAGPKFSELFGDKSIELAKALLFVRFPNIISTPNIKYCRCSLKCCTFFFGDYECSYRIIQD
jgi:hypothetical protein